MKTTCSIGLSGPIEAHAAGVGEALGTDSDADVSPAFVVGERGGGGDDWEGSSSPTTEQDANVNRLSATSVHPACGRARGSVPEPVRGGSRRDDGATIAR
jgi:hypothetical protein